MKRTVIIGLIIILTIGGALYLGLIKPPIKNSELENKVVEHFLNRGISQEEYSLEVKYYWENRLLGYNPYKIKVVFKDEPEVNYYYEYRYNSQIESITQGGIAPMNNREDKNFKHIE